MGFEPKSAWRNCLVELMLAIYTAESGFTGACAMLWFQGLLDGNTWHPPILVSEVGADARVGAGVRCVAFWVGVALTAATEADGELLGTLPAEITVIPNAFARTAICVPIPPTPTTTAVLPFSSIPWNERGSQVCCWSFR